MSLQRHIVVILLLTDCAHKLVLCLGHLVRLCGYEPVPWCWREAVDDSTLGLSLPQNHFNNSDRSNGVKAMGMTVSLSSLTALGLRSALQAFPITTTSPKAI